MSRNLKKLLESTLVLLLLFTVHVEGSNLLPHKYNIQQLEIVRAIGIDKKEDGVKITLVFNQMQINDKSGNPAEKLTVAFGRTVMDALEKMQLTESKTLFWGHADLLVLGYDAVKEDILRYLDFCVRDRKTRMSMRVLVAKEQTAEELLKRKNAEGQAIFDALGNHLENMPDFSYASEVKLSDVISDLGNDLRYTKIPLVELKGEEQFQITGYAILKEQEWVTNIEDRHAKAFSMLDHTFYNGVYVLNTKVLGRISVDLTDCTARRRIVVTNGAPGMELRVRLKGVLAEQFDSSGVGNSLTKETAADIGRMLSGVIEQDIRELLRRSQEENLDFLGFGDDIFRKKPGLEKEWLTKWEHYYPDMPISLSVQAEISNAYVIREEL